MVPLAEILLAAAALAGPVRHPGPPVYLELEIRQDRVRLQVIGEQQAINPWLGLRPPTEAEAEKLPAADRSPLPAAAERTARAALDILVRDGNPLAIDGRRVAPVLGPIEVRGDLARAYGLPAISFAFDYACSGTPERIHLVWKLYEGALWADKDAIPLVIRSFGVTDQYFLRPGEPEYIWHREMVRPRQRPEVAEVVAAPPEPATLPVVPLVVLVLLFVSIPLFRSKSVGLPAAAAVWLVGLAAAAVLWDAVRVDLPGTGSVRVPDEQHALALFDRLHRNVYAAFEAGTEDEIYDLLAKSVDRRLLDELYGQVYESLVMRSQGGAVCKVEKIEVLEREAMVDLPVTGTDPAPKFFVTWKWRVHGLVTHWGHTHRRINEYEANYTVRHDGRSWKISDLDVLEASRVDKDG